MNSLPQVQSLELGGFESQHYSALKASAYSCIDRKRPVPYDLVARKESELVVKRAAQSTRVPFGAKFKKKFAVNFEVLLTA
jgi:hypothetical protein